MSHVSEFFNYIFIHSQFQKFLMYSLLFECPSSQVYFCSEACVQMCACVHMYSITEVFTKWLQITHNVLQFSSFLLNSKL